MLPLRLYMMCSQVAKTLGRFCWPSSRTHTLQEAMLKRARGAQQRECITTISPVNAMVYL